MIGSTNVISKKSVVEKVNLTLKTNQTSHNDLIDAAFTVQYGTYSKKYSWDGNEVIIEIPAYVEYSIIFNEVNGYATPASLTYTAISGNARTINAVYKTEIVSVTVNANNGESVVGQVLTINGTQHTWNNSVIIQKIPFGTVYEVSVNDKEEYVTPQAQSFTANKANRNVTMQYAEIPVIDLSKVDIYGNPIMQNTANCYIIKEAGKYMFPIAYGAAIKNGEANPAAYTNNGGAYSHDFVNYLGNVIASPYVETDTATQAAKVQISIADTDSLLSDLQIVEKADCRYVQFKVDSVPVTGANLVLSVKNASGVIMWNWHIWLWEDDLTSVEITNSTSVKYKILPVNLASKWDDTAKTKIKNWYYQFGRPNPMLCPSAYNSTSNHASFGSLGFTIASAASHLYKGIQNPTTFFKNNDTPPNWFGTKSYYNLWDAACKSTGNSDNNVVKTIYDPCPIGFKMPNGNTFTGFSILSSANGIVKFTRYSWDSTGVEFPMSGCRLESGSLYGVGSYGYVRLSSAKSQSLAYDLYFNVVKVTPQSTYNRTSSYSVRPVQDGDLALPTHKLTINVSGDEETPSGYEIGIYGVSKSVDETTGEVTETLGDLIATQTSASATHELTWGTKYKIVCGDVESYITPASQSYVADVEYRSVNLEYVYRPGTLNPTNGVYILDTDGYYHTKDEWDGSYTADCVAVITDACRFGIALDSNSTRKICKNHTDPLENYMTVPSDPRTDYNGYTNTANIMKLQSGTSYAAGWCNAYTFPSGKRGFLPALGQLLIAFNNKDAIKDALSKAGGTNLINNTGSCTYQSSTFFGLDYLDRRRCWHIAWENGNTGFGYIGASYYVRVFCSV